MQRRSYFFSRLLPNIGYSTVRLGLVRLGEVWLRWVWFGYVEFGLVTLGLVRFYSVELRTTLHRNAKIVRTYRRRFLIVFQTRSTPPPRVVTCNFPELNRWEISPRNFLKRHRFFGIIILFLHNNIYMFHYVV